MKFAASNIALTAYNHGAELRGVANLGLEGLEVAPSRVWPDSWRGLKAADVQAYRATVESAGLHVIGLHSLFFDQPDLGLFRDSDTRAATQDFLVHLSGLCRDLGGRTLIYGGGRKRNDLPLEDAFVEAIAFFEDLIPRIEDHGTIFCFEPLGPADSDFVNSVHDSIRIAEALDHPALAVQIDAKALVDNDELDAQTVAAAKSRLVHVHANEPGLGVLGSSGAVDHGALGRHLKAIAYDGYVSIEQRMLREDDPVSDLAISARVLKDCYQ